MRITTPKNKELQIFYIDRESVWLMSPWYLEQHNWAGGALQ